MKVEKITTPLSFDGSEGLIATIVKSSPMVTGTSFATDPGSSLQVGVLRHREGWSSLPHQHSLSLREVQGGGEVLIIVYGILHVEFYDSAGNWVARRTLTGGDILIQHAGGHSFLAWTDFHAIEVKQGPYKPEEKTYLPTKG